MNPKGGSIPTKKPAGQKDPERLSQDKDSDGLGGKDAAYEPLTALTGLGKQKGNLIVITGPSGVGKGTLVKKLMEDVCNLVKSVSVTTRERRAGEEEGVDYFFKTTGEFLTMRKANHFMEWAEFAGYLYGTPREWVIEQIDKGIDVILEIEVQGAKQIRESVPTALLIFLSPPSYQELEDRLKNRATESPERMAIRLSKARQEMEERLFFHYEVVNDNIDEAVKNLAHIVYAERCRIRKREAGDST